MPNDDWWEQEFPCTASNLDDALDLCTILQLANQIARILLDLERFEFLLGGNCLDLPSEVIALSTSFLTLGAEDGITIFVTRRKLVDESLCLPISFPLILSPASSTFHENSLLPHDHFLKL